MGLSTKELLALSETILATPEPVKDVVATNSIVEEEGIADVKVPDSFMDQVLGFAGNLNEACKTNKKSKYKTKSPDTILVSKPEEVDTSLDEAKVLREKLETLVIKLRGLLKEASSIMKEVTTTGLLGKGTDTTLGMKRSDNSYPPTPKKKKVRNNGSR